MCCLIVFWICVLDCFDNGHLSRRRRILTLDILELSMSKTFVICPKEYWSFGPKINHGGQDKANCRSMKFIGDRGIEVIIVANKKFIKEISTFTIIMRVNRGNMKPKSFKNNDSLLRSFVFELFVFPVLFFSLLLFL